MIIYLKAHDAVTKPVGMITHSHTPASKNIQFSPSKAESEQKSESRYEWKPESELARRVLALLQMSAKGKVDLARGLRHHSVSGALNQQIRHLLLKQLIEMTVPEKPISRLQKYQLTEKG